jgi:two-component system, cell cycle response regulator CpdR
MTADRNPILARFEPPEASRAEAAWVGGEAEAKLPVIRGKRILLVDDQQPVRASLRMLLELDDHQVTEAGNGAEALKIFTVGEFDLVITDFEMPVMEGNELAGSLKLLDPALPILMVTASERARRGVENPVDALLNKPSTMRELRCALGKLLSPRPVPAQSAAVQV